MENYKNEILEIDFIILFLNFFAARGFARLK